MPDADQLSAAPADPARIDPAAEQQLAKSDGQQLLERLLTTHKRLSKIAGELDLLRYNVTGKVQSKDRVISGLQATPITVFFVALERMADEFNRVSDDIEASVKDIAAKF
ncbi:hypothetical protein HNQ36_001098 [Afipia massiliensis]|uniref:Uncharacterized protein n=1 Tax=Afipia massiliensis TaxID=211460 RepID=A0A840MXK0_9BRAD|nr:hypothetical protein [Afipia massiliensis]MBB5051144.1 hypothetical protein [Afipia massiliensis]